MSTADPRFVQNLLRLYPAGWRARYADELAATLTATMADRRGLRQRWRVAADVAAGAADAHLHPAGGAAPAPAARPDRIRNAACLAFCAFAFFCLAGSGFQKMSEDPAFTTAARAHARVGWSYDVVLYGAIVAALAVALASLPVLLSIARQARAGRQDLLKPLVVPPLATAAWFGLVFGVARLHHAGVHSPVNVVAFLGIVVAAVVVAGLSAAALVTVTRRAELPAPVKRSAWMPMTVLSAAMVAVTAADLVWGLSLPPSLYDSHNGILATPLPLTWIGTLAVMAATSAVAVAATAQAIRLARGTDRPETPPAALSQPG
jgi:hypothetical protein